jgi:SAM-dependent methyltransferase
VPVFPTRGEIFDAINRASDDYVDFIAKFLSPTSSNVELGCGTGRLLVPLAERGHPMVGVDNDDEMLDVARAKLTSRNLGGMVPLVKGDFGTVRLPEPVDAAYFSTDTLCLVPLAVDRSRAIMNAAAHLRRGGRLVLPFNNPATYLTGRHQRLCHSGHIPGRGVIVVSERRELDLRHWWRVGHKQLRFHPDGPEAAEERAITRVLAIVTANEIRLLFRAAGLQLAARYGSFAAEPLTARSAKAIFVGVKE